MKIAHLQENQDTFHIRYIFGPRELSVAEIILLQPLDYEKRNLYVLKLLALVSLDPMID